MTIKRIIASDVLSTMLGTSITIYLYWFAYDRFSDQGVVALIGFGQLSGVLLSVLGGGLSDMVNKFTFIRVLKGIKVFLFLSVFVLQGWVATKELLTILMMCSAAIGGLLSPSLEAIIPFMVQTDEELYRVNATVSSMTQIASILGSILSAVLIAGVSFRGTVLVGVLLSLLAWWLVLGISIQTPVQEHSIWNTIGQGLGYLWKTAAIRNLIPIALVMNFSFWSIFLLLPKVVGDSFSFMKMSYSVLELSFSLGGIFGGWLFAKYLLDCSQKYILFRQSLLVQSILLLLLGVNLYVLDGLVAYILLLVIWFSYAMTNTVFSIVYFSQLQSMLPKEMIGSVFGSLLTIFSFVNPVAATVSPLLVKLFSIPVSIMLLSGLMLAAAVAVNYLPDIQEVFLQDRKD